MMPSALRWIRTHLPASLVIGTLLITMLVSLAGLEDYPYLNCDEAIYSSVAASFADTGRFGSGLFGGLWGRDLNAPEIGRLDSIGRGLLFAVTGSKSLLVARIPSFLGWVAAVALTYLAGRKLYSPFEAGLGALALATNLHMYGGSHSARPDIFLAAANMGLMLYVLWLRARPTRLGFLFMGILLGLTPGFHLSGVWFSVSVVALLTYFEIRTPEGRWRLVMLAIGGLLGLACLLGLLLLPDIEFSLRSFEHVASFNTLSDGTVPERIAAQWYWLVETGFAGFNRAVFVFALYSVAALVWAIRRSSPSDRLILFVAGLSFFIFLVTTLHKNPFYFSAWLPFLSLLIGSAVWALARRGEARLRIPAQWGAVMLIAPLIALNVGAQVWLTIKFRERDIEAYHASVLELVPPDVHVFADPRLWFAFYGRNPFTSDEYYRWYQSMDMSAPLTGEDIERIQTELEVEYVIVDRTVGCSDPEDPNAALHSAYVARTCTPVGTVEDRWFGVYGDLGRGEPSTVYDCRTR